MKPTISGIHHVTAIAGSPQQNVDFYVGLLGLRLVKRTVNFDDPGTYHLYYGDRTGTPGSILTFFPWPHGTRGMHGGGMATRISFSVPAGALSFWVDRLRAAGQSFDGPFSVHGRPTLSLPDPDGLPVRLVEGPAPADPNALAPGANVPVDHAIRFFDGVRLSVHAEQGTERVLTQIFGFEKRDAEDGVARFVASGDAPGAIVDVAEDRNTGRMGVGIIHHVAFRARDDQEQLYWREVLTEAGLRVTDVRDRSYFRSIYFREPGGVLFEIATDAPGFLIDEDVEQLGSELKLPHWLEPHRPRIEQELPPLVVP